MNLLGWKVTQVLIEKSSCRKWLHHLQTFQNEFIWGKLWKCLKQFTTNVFQKIVLIKRITRIYAMQLWCSSIIANDSLLHIYVHRNPMISNNHPYNCFINWLFTNMVIILHFAIPFLKKKSFLGFRVGP